MLSFTFSGGMAFEAPGLELYEHYPAMRNRIDQVSGWTGLDAAQLLTEDLATPFYAGDLSGNPDLRYIAEVRQVAYSIGIAEVLAEMGIRPTAIGGSSLGFMIGSCLAGAVDAKELFDLLRYSTSLPLAPAGEPDRGIAVCVVSDDAQLARYCGDTHPDVYLAAEIGEFIDGKSKMYMLSGYLDALIDLATQEPPGHVNVVSVLGGAHNPLQEFVVEMIRPRIENLNFRDPRVALYSGLQPERRVTADDVREDYLHNPVRPTYMSNVLAGFEQHGTQLAVVLGVAAAVSLFRFPFPVVQVLKPDDFGQLAMMIHDLGLDLTSA